MKSFSAFETFLYFWNLSVCFWNLSVFETFVCLFLKHFSVFETFLTQLAAHNKGEIREVLHIEDGQRVHKGTIILAANDGQKKLKWVVTSQQHLIHW